MLRKTFALSLVVVLACSLFFAVSIKSASASGTNQIFWGAFVGPSHIDPPSSFKAFGTLVGKGLSIWENFQYWDRIVDSENDPNFDTAWMNACRDYGAIPLVTWDPGQGVGGDTTDYWAEILNHQYDSYIKAWAQAAAAWGHPFFIRMFHEQDFVLSSQECTEFVQSWQYIWNIFNEYGANDVSWVWSPSNYGIQNYEVLYPGDKYVDWTGMGDYNFGNDKTFSQIFSGFYSDNLQIAPTKPQMLVEVGFGESIYKASLLTYMLTIQLPNNFPDIKALVYWEGYIGGMTDSNIVESDTASLSAFQQGIASNYYNSNVYGSLNISPITALGENPNLTLSPTLSSYPMSSPAHSPTASSSFGASDVVIIVVVVVIAFVVVAPKSRKLLCPENG